MEEFTQEELAELEALGLGAPPVQEKKDIFSFFNKVVGTKDTIKVSNLEDNELTPVRVLRDASVLSDILGHDLISDYFKKKAEVILGSALSKKGFLVEMAVTSKKESLIGTKARRSNKGWFTKKETEA
jgi:hypothetical protein